MRAGSREQRLLDANRALQKTVALRAEGTVTGKLRRRYRGSNVIKFIARREWSIERNVDHDELKTADGSPKPIVLSPSTASFITRKY